MRDVHLCTWCGVQVTVEEPEGASWLCLDCEEARQSDALRYVEGPKEDMHDL